MLRNNMPEEETLQYRVSIYIASCCDLLARIRRLIYNESPEKACLSFSEILDSVAAIDSMVVEVKPSRQWNSTELYFLNTYRTARIKIYYAVAQLIDYIEKLKIPHTANLVDKGELQQQSATGATFIRKVAQDILDTLPILLVSSDDGDATRGSKLSSSCWVNGMRLVIPLTLVARMSATLPSQKEQASKTLFRIGKQLGVRQALVQNLVPFKSLPRLDEQKTANGPWSHKG